MTSSPAPPRKKKRLVRWLLITPPVLLFAAFAGAVIYVKVRAEIRLARAIKGAETDTPNWRLEALRASREAVPDAENSARTIAAVRALLPAEWADPEATTPLTTLSVKVLEAPPDERLAPPLVATIRETLEEVGPALELARTIADKPKGRLIVTYGKVYYAGNYEACRPLRPVAQMLALDVALRAEDGDADVAIDSCRAALNVARAIGDEPTLVPQLARYSLGTSAMTLTRRVLGQGQPGEEAMARCQALWEDESDQNLYLVGLRGERAGIDDVLDGLTSGRITPADLGAKGAGSGRPGPLNFWFGPYHRYSRAAALDTMNRHVEITRAATARQADMWAERDRDHHDTGAIDRFLEMLAHTLTGQTMAPRDIFPRYAAESRVVVALLAAERHRLRTGAFPASLEKIDRSILSKPPLDPYDGKPVRLIERDGILIVYTLGTDRTDNGGAIDYEWRKWFYKGVDLGQRLWPPDSRRKPAPLPDLPENVFQATPGEDVETP